MHTPRQTHSATNCQYCVTLAQQTKSTAEPNAPRIIGARAPWRSNHLPVGMAVTAATTRLTERAIEISADDQPRSSVIGLMNRSEEHTSELQSLMRISYAVFCLKKKKKRRNYRY